MATHKEWEKHTAVFTAVRRGSLMQELDKFSDDQLQPFLPLLVSSKFGPNSSSVAPELFARLTTFSRESFILDCLKVDYTEVAKRINDFSNYNTTSKSPADKYVYYVSKLLRTEIVDSNLHQWVGDSELPMATLLLSLAILHMPSVVKTSLVVTRLLSIQNGPQILAEIACNVPSEIDLIIQALLTKVTPEDTPKGKNREQMLMNLLSLCPVLITDRVLAKLTEHKRDAALAARLCALIGSDTQFVRFMSSHLTDNTSPVHIVIRRSAQKPQVVAPILQRTFAILRKLVESKNHEPNPEFIMALAQLKILCQGKPSREDLELLQQYLTFKIPVHSHTHAALCALLSITSLTSAQQSTPNASTPHNEQRWMVDYLQWLKAEAIASHKRQDSTFHSILVAALCVWTGRVDEINRFLGSSLSCKVAITSRHFQAIRALLLSVLPEKELVLLCVDLPVTIDLHDSHESSEPLPILWISDLLSQKVFQKYNVDVGSWIGRQISAAALPTSAVLIEVIERLAEHASHVTSVVGLSREFCEEVLSGQLVDKEKTVPRILVLQYLLAYHRGYALSGRKGSNIYESLYKKIPIRYLLSLVMAQEEYAAIRGSLLRCATALFPYMWPTRESIELVRVDAAREGRPVPPDAEIESTLSGEQHAAARKMCRDLEQASAAELARLLPIIVRASKKCLPKVVPAADFSESGSLETSLIAEPICRLWARIEAIVPRELMEQTLASWQLTPFSVAQAYVQPCLVFNVDKRVFASPPHFQILLKLLSFFLEAARAEEERIVLRANMKTNNMYDDQKRICDERDHLFVVLDHAQRAASVQLLIEICDSEKNTNVGCIERFESVRHLAFNYIHSIFIRDMQVLKLVLFETFPLHMIRPIVDGVPSMHVAQGLIQEMLSFPDNKRRIFTAILIVEIFKKYRVEMTFPFVQSMLNALCTLLRYGGRDQVLRLFNGIIEELGELAMTYPDLKLSIIRMFGQVCAIAESRLCLYSTHIISGKALERRLIRRIDDQIRVLNEQVPFVL